MSCVYTYLDFSAPSIQELRNKIFAEANDQIKKDFFASNSDFCYYSLDSQSDIKNAIAENAKRYDSRDASAVTNFINSIIYGDDSSPIRLGDAKSLEQVLSSFQIELGTAIHTVFEAVNAEGEEKTKLWEKFQKSVREVAKQHAAKYDEIYKPLKDAGYSGLAGREGDVSKYLHDLATSVTTQQQLYRIALDRAIKIIEKYKTDGCVILAEQKLISSASTGGSPLRGRADAIVITPDGRVEILDFKNTWSPTMLDKTRAAHWGQLEAYAKILSSYGIEPSRISYKNIIFNIDPIDSELIRVTEDDFSTRRVADSYRSKIVASFTKFFPRKIVVSGKVEDKLKNIKQKHTALCSERFLKEIVSDDIRTDFINRSKNAEKGATFSFMCLSEPSKTNYRQFLFDGDTVTIVLRKKDGAIVSSKTCTLDEFVAAESKARIEHRIKLFDEVVTAVREKDFSFLIDSDEHNVTSRYHNLIQYFSPKYEYVCTPMENEFIITFKNIQKGTYEFVQWIPSVSNFEYSPNPEQHILESIVTDPKALNAYANTGMRYCIGDIYRLRAALTIGEFIDGFDSEGQVKIGDIKLMSSAGITDAKITNLENITQTLRLLQTLCQKGKYKNGDLFKNCYDNFSKIGLATTDEILENSIVNAATATLQYYGHDSTAEALENWDFEESISEKKKALNDLIQTLTKEVSSVTSGHLRTKFIDALDYCKALLERLDNTLSGMYAEEMSELNQHSATWQESFVMAFNVLCHGTIKEYTKKGLQLTGLLQGLSTSSSYSNPDQFNNRFNAFVDNAIAQIIEQTTREGEEVNKASEAFIKSYGKSWQIINDNDSVYKTLFADERQMILKNPYAERSSLSAEQQRYLEVIIWNIYKHAPSYRRSLKDYRDSNYLRMTFDEFSKSDKFNAYKDEISNNEIFLFCPLLNGQSNVRNLGKAFKEKGGLKKFFYNTINRMKNNLNGDNFAEFQRDKQDRDLENFKIQNKYWNWKDINERTAIAQSETGWTYNLNQVVIDYILEDVKTMQFKNILQMADRALSEIRIIELATGKDFSKQAEELLNRVKISVYGRNLIDKEFNDLTVAQGIIKEFTSLTKIALRPGLWVKEMVLGRLRNTMNVLTNQIENDNKITMEHLTKAAGIVFGPNFFGEYGKKMFGDMHFGEKTIVDLLNEIYQINDMDLPVAREKMAWDSYGLRNFGSRVLYTNVISPDWFNRMTLLVGKMLADGTWEAHSIKDGKLVYDIAKDARVKEFWKHRNDAIEPKTRAYIDAKNFYLYRMQQFEKEGWKNPDGSYLHYSKGHYDSFPRCYTTAEMRSYKEQIGLIYGYYSHQERASIQKGLWWHLYTQFLTFLPAEVRRNLAIGTKSSIFKTVQEKDGITGKPLFWEADETGLLRKTENEYDKEGNPNRKVLTDLICPREGLFISTLWTLNKLFRLDAKAIKQNPQRLKNSTMWLFNHLLFALMCMILKTIFGGGKDEDSRAVAMTEDTIYRVSKELDMYHSVIQPLGDFGFVGQDILRNTFVNAFRGITQDGYSLFDAANDSFSVLSDMHLDLD